MSPDLPSPPDKSKAFIIFIAAAVAAAAIGYMGYHQFIQWHEKEVQTAVSKEKQEMTKTKAELEAQIQDLQSRPPTTETLPTDSPAVSDERLTEVFGSAPVDATTPDTESEPSCDALNRQIVYFFNYLIQHAKPSTETKKTVPPNWVTQMMMDLSASPPLVVEETRDMDHLKRNEKHFFRVLKKERINMIKTVLFAEKDVLEHALSDCYQYYVSIGCCNPGDPNCVSLKTLYEYAGFFMTTLSGKSYLLRRDSTIRCLTNYYCILILDHANDAELNPYGIDIRPYIDLAMDAVSHQNNLIFKDRYIDTLNRLTIKYPPQTQPSLPDTAEGNNS